jgi:probable HAF family extracellular repeat protein
MKRLVRMLLFSVVLWGGWPYPVAADSFSFTILDVPGSFSTVAHGINDAGHIVGAMDTDVPSALGFLLTSAGVVPLRVPDSVVTVAYDINDADQIVGAFFGDRDANGFLYSAGSFTTVLFPDGNDYTQALGINNLGQIVGVSASGGFLLEDGHYSTLTISDTPRDVSPRGINDAGQIVGSLGGFGFLYDGRSTTLLEVPGSSHTEAESINDAGDVVGSFTQRNKEHGFLWTGDRYVTLDVPDSSGTHAYGINDRGQIVGAFVDAEGLRQGFVATPVPEPGTLTLLSVGLVAPLWYGCRRANDE